jgi:hypothetical protein
VALRGGYAAPSEVGAPVRFAELLDGGMGKLSQSELVG